MRVGIVTFHWADNYGAVLQAYALQTYLQSLGHDVEIVDYYPEWARQRFEARYNFKGVKGLILRLDKRKRLSRFNKFTSKYLNISDVQNGCYDMVITGSDQVFNPDIIAFNGNLDLKYLLENINTKYKISYAASFGNSTLEERYKADFKNSLSKFNFVGVREQSGVEILRSMGLESVYLNPDPTFLINDYSELIDIAKKRDRGYIFKYVFHNTAEIDLLEKGVTNALGGKKVISPVDILQILHGSGGIYHAGVKKWLRTIRDAHFVITDSFHCTVFCILFHTPFIAINQSGWGKDWGERIKCLLSSVGLSPRLLETNANIAEVCNSDIDWTEVDRSFAYMRESGREYLKRVLVELGVQDK